MKAYKFGFPVKAEDFHYAILEYTYFEIREVLINGEPKGEYHIKALDKSKLINAVTFLKKHFQNCEIGIIDSSGILNLEYPIYLIAKTEMDKLSIISTFDTIDEELKNKSL